MVALSFTVMNSLLRRVSQNMTLSARVGLSSGRVTAGVVAIASPPLPAQAQRTRSDARISDTIEEMRFFIFILLYIVL
jgi:hypothetical protein